MPFLLKFDNLNYHNSDGALNNFSLSLKKNEIRAVIAKNSIDQSVLLDAILKYESTNLPTGKFTLNNVELSPIDIPYLSDIQVMHSTPQLIENLSIRENLFFNSLEKFSFLSLINWKKLSSKTQFYTELLGLSCSPKSLVNTLSIEEKKMIYLLKIILREPKVIILQEPFKDLSPTSLPKIKELLRNYAANGNGIIILTKHWDDALKLSDEISILNKGTIINEISTHEAAKNPTELVKWVENLHIHNSQNSNNESHQIIEAVFKASEFLTSEFELNEILKLLIKEGISAFQATNGSIILFDEGTGAIIDEFISNDFNYPVYSISSNMIHSTIENKKVEKKVISESVIKTVYLIPVYTRKQIYGIMQLNYVTDKSFSAKEVMYMESFARHIALAIDDTRLMGNSTYIRESHHRIKNNLQTVAHLITLQKDSLLVNPNQTVHDVLDSITNYVKSIAVVHDLISKDYYGRSIINLREMVHRVLDVLDMHSNIKVTKILEDHFIPYNKATSITLIVNELITNCYKHAFTNVQAGEIIVRIYKNHQYLYILIEDNGKGLPSDFSLQSNAGIGLSILQSILSGEFKGEITILASDVGTTFKISIPLNRLMIST